MKKNTASTHPLIIVGALHVDDIAKPESSLIPKASNPVRWYQYLGGVAANAAIAASRINQSGVPLTLISAVGDDDIAKRLQRLIKNHDIHPNLVTLANQSTGRYSAVLDGNNELYIGLADVGLAECLTIDNLSSLQNLTPNHTLVVDANLSSTCIEQLCIKAKQKHCQVVALAVSPSKAIRLLPMASYIDVLICNRREASALCPSHARANSLYQLADAIKEIGFEQCVITDGAQPLVVSDLRQHHTLQILSSLPIYSVNGAGDALAGATCLAWSQGSTLYKAVAEHGLPAATAVVSGKHQPLSVS